MTKRNAILAACVVGVVGLAACGGGSSTTTGTGDETNTTGTSGGENGGTTDADAGTATTDTGGGGGDADAFAARVAAGQEKFDHVCGTCHPGGEGDTGPDLHNKHFTVERMTNQIRNGSGRMRPIAPARLSDEELPNVLAWLSTIGAVDGVHWSSGRASRALVLASLAALVAAGVVVRVAAQDNVQAAPACREQAPQDFLVRSNFAGRGHFTPEQVRARRETLAKAIRYRTEHYGYFPGFGSAWNAHPPSFYAKNTTFMGLRVRLNEQIIPAVACAEAEIRRTCADHPYTPTHLSGLRDHNTYRGGEVSNHVYGVALDVDPTRNTCCGCVPPWNDAPACHREAASVYERMEMPECWVHAFEKYGFYWLGHDQLMDTMHFEFLGDPAAITR